MSAPVIAPLNNSRTARDLILEIKVAGTYQPLTLKNVAPNGDNAHMEPENRYSDGGYDRNNKTGTGWSVTATVPMATLVSDPTSYDAATTYLMQTIEGALGSDAQVDIRWYEFDPSVNSPRVYCRQGIALATFLGNFGDPTANRDATLTFTGQGKLNKPVHPYPQTPAVPTVSAVLPTSASHLANTAITIYGAHFTGTTGVTVGGVAVTSFNINSDGEIVAVMAAGTAGAGKAIVVTNAAGASSGGATVTLT